MVLTWSDLLLDLNLGQLDLEHLGDHPDSHLEQIAVVGGLLILLLISITEPAAGVNILRKAGTLVPA